MSKNKRNMDEIIDIFEPKSIDCDENILGIPEGCRACGGPYPSCMSSCPMFDD